MRDNFSHIPEYDLKTNKIAQEVSRYQSQRGEQKRCVSEHVGTRWYRAPEISLMEKTYD